MDLTKQSNRAILPYSMNTYQVTFQFKPGRYTSSTTELEAENERKAVELALTDLSFTRELNEYTLRSITVFEVK